MGEPQTAPGGVLKYFLKFAGRGGRCSCCRVSSKAACLRSQTSPAVVTPLRLATSLQIEEVSLPSGTALTLALEPPRAGKGPWGLVAGPSSPRSGVFPHLKNSKVALQVSIQPLSQHPAPCTGQARFALSKHPRCCFVLLLRAARWKTSN